MLRTLHLISYGRMKRSTLVGVIESQLQFTVWRGGPVYLLWNTSRRQRVSNNLYRRKTDYGFRDDYHL